MKKSMCSTDSLWYDESVYNAVMALNDKYPNAIPVFGGALGAFNALEVGDYDRFKSLMLEAINDAKFFKWHESALQVARRFCHLCYVDPMLVEVYIGLRLEEWIELNL